MQEFSGIVSGPLAIDRDTRISGMVDGDVRVAEGCTVEVSGMVSGNIILDPGANATVSGLVHGTIVRR